MPSREDRLAQVSYEAYSEMAEEEEDPPMGSPTHPAQPLPPSTPAPARPPPPPLTGGAASSMLSPSIHFAPTLATQGGGPRSLPAGFSAPPTAHRSSDSSESPTSLMIELDAISESALAGMHHHYRSSDPMMPAPFTRTPSSPPQSAGTRPPPPGPPARRPTVTTGLGLTSMSPPAGPDNGQHNNSSGGGTARWYQPTSATYDPRRMAITTPQRSEAAGPNGHLAVPYPGADRYPPTGLANIDETEDQESGPNWEPFASPSQRAPILPRWLSGGGSSGGGSGGNDGPPTDTSPRRNRSSTRRLSTVNTIPLRERVLLQWRDYANQDEFFDKVYHYFAGKGVWSIFLSRLLNLLILGFVVSFTVFLFGCVDHTKIRSAKSLAAVIVPHCLTSFTWLSQLALLLFVAFYALQLYQLIVDLRRLMEMRYFYAEVLGISNSQLQTCTWNEVVQMMIELRDQDLSAMKAQAETTLYSPAAQAAHSRRLKNLRLNAHDITNRIMRKDNYMIALFNKDLVDISLPLSPWLPFAHWFGTPSGPAEPPGTRSLRPEYNSLSKTLEWNLAFCLVGPVFDANGQVNRK
ncbi:autophagy protein Apg9-domain-containing protein, partial [Dimargaris cristalligena]